MTGETLNSTITPVCQLPVALNADLFLRSLIRELAGTLEEVVGVEDALGFISVVGNRMGDVINEEYRRSLAVENIAKEQLAEILLDLKQRINGDFYVVSQDEEKLVLGSRRCPFGDKVKGKQSLCMMTSNVFGKIVAENTGYARVDLEKTIADHAPECRVVIYFATTTDHSAKGREYYREL